MSAGWRVVMGGTAHTVTCATDTPELLLQAQPNALQQFLNYSPAPQQALVKQSAAFGFLALLALIQVSLHGPPCTSGSCCATLGSQTCGGAACMHACARVRARLGVLVSAASC